MLVYSFILLAPWLVSNFKNLFKKIKNKKDNASKREKKIKK
jgi:hypothetical protein